MFIIVRHNDIYQIYFISSSSMRCVDSSLNIIKDMLRKLYRS